MTVAGAPDALAADLDIDIAIETQVAFAQLPAGLLHGLGDGAAEEGPGASLGIGIGIGIGLRLARGLGRVGFALACGQGRQAGGQGDENESVHAGSPGAVRVGLGRTGLVQDP